MKYTIELTNAEKEVICNVITAIRNNSLGEQRLFDNTTLFKFDEKSTDYDAVYRKGIENGKLWAAEANAKDRQGYYDKGYNKGLDDACLTAWTLLTSTHTGEIFTEYGLVSDILGNVPMKEIRSRIKAYEEKKKAEEEPIKVGDEVLYGSSKLLVTKITNASICTVNADGKVDTWRATAELIKTGRHFNEVSQLLDNLKGE